MSSLFGGSVLFELPELLELFELGVLELCELELLELFELCEGVTPSSNSESGERWYILPVCVELNEADSVDEVLLESTEPEPFVDGLLACRGAGIAGEFTLVPESDVPDLDDSLGDGW